VRDLRAEEGAIQRVESRKAKGAQEPATRPAGEALGARAGAADAADAVPRAAVHFPPRALVLAHVPPPPRVAAANALARAASCLPSPASHATIVTDGTVTSTQACRDGRSSSVEGGKTKRASIRRRVRRQADARGRRGWVGEGARPAPLQYTPSDVSPGQGCWQKSPDQPASHEHSSTPRLPRTQRPRLEHALPVPHGPDCRPAGGGTVWSPASPCACCCGAGACTGTACGGAGGGGGGSGCGIA